ncbi:MAG: hypothetical protein A2655_01515 [Candidatus Yanofskybacteria bacterium RIFCSPHIGHO2_01_FULL_43_42]|uniref:BioF2-like acetyltransferase domain-containing protein n=1 Tax=Candidatus Yanofskybacteria bacterium RIFCSPLOWO2_01_FULL_43_22 TaxID=1802695 RepID=A0A1F8GGZ1_9BACT|nr:MAG: hypothetical protein A2655_01515 [Candidatus Yanofskybacteria bacterium RIFCSPHIGHO2_01_FULL_43_42]OGN13159.1 MAG: hypothetical protein A3D48_02425 [Candidatus Yanofskybacteria bacterium RIFCSPHIGHO2_02_FULL_43_17]OGN24573.1 MAG: hypothetical protein A3A13_00645 [Candidatus Yanofskybacteria bacterium RIFCSPLOWO2_01_FULL_43_22]
MKSFLQTTEWLKFQEQVGHKTWRFDNGKIRANIIQHKIPFGKNYLYIPHGPEILFDKISGGLKNEIDNFLKYLKELAKENKSIFVKMEPLADVVTELVFRKGIKRSKKEIQPSRSVIINLSLSEGELLERMHHKTRYNIKVAERNKVKVEDSNNLDIFWKLLGHTTKRDRFFSHGKDYYQKLLALNGGEFKVDLVLAYYESKPVAGAIILCYGDTGYYLHGASDYNHHQLMAPYALHWENIKHLKREGFKYYDFWGIDAQKWPGVTRFKLGWGGDAREYPGSFDIPISKFWYFMYRIVRRAF